MDQNPEVEKQEYSCSDIEQQLDGFLDEQLNSEQLNKFQKHTSNCASCEKLVAEFVQIREVARSLAEVEIPCGIRDRLRTRLAQETDWSRSRSNHLRLVK